tara:strand:- start:3843 stop:4139 length:297 start_codon:yes stop_codon:yes gene_type:complete
MKKLFTDSILIEQTKERIRRILPHIEKLDVKVEMNHTDGYLTTIKFHSLGKDFVAKKAAPFYRESLEKSLKAINSQVTKFRDRRFNHPNHRVETYTTI